MRASSGTGDLRGGLEDAIDLVERVVVAEADAGRAAGGAEAEALHDRHRVVVAVPDEDPALRERLGVVAGVTVVEAKRERRRALVDARWVGDAEEAHARREAAEEAFGEPGLVRRDAIHGGDDAI